MERKKEKSTLSLLQRWRRDMHQHPQTGWLTFRTSVMAADLLKTCGCQVYVGEEILSYEDATDPTDQAEVLEAKAQTLSLAGTVKLHTKKEYQSHNAKNKYAGMATDPFSSDRMTKDSEAAPEEYWQEEEITIWLERMGRVSGVVGIYDTRISGKTKLFRCDMDALPIIESKDACRVAVKEGFVSVFEGNSHACGHDGHSAILLGLIHQMFLQDQEKRKELTGKYLFLFQPAEEGARGAKSICKHWKFGKIDECYSFHIGFTESDTLVAGATSFLATSKMNAFFHGKTAHAGLCPEKGKNALLAAAEAVVKMQEITFPDTDADTAAITRLNVGRLIAGETRNSIPEYASMELETRGSDNERNAYMREEAVRTLTEAGKKYGVQVRIEEIGACESADSSSQLASHIYEIGKTTHIFSKCKQTQSFGASDDATIFMNYVANEGGQAAYLLFGATMNGSNHQPVFDFDEQVLEQGCALLYALV